MPLLTLAFAIDLGFVLMPTSAWFLHASAGGLPSQPVDSQDTMVDGIACLLDGKAALSLLYTEAHVLERESLCCGKSSHKPCTKTAPAPQYSTSCGRQS